jgi:hypothetical protein
MAALVLCLEGKEIEKRKNKAKQKNRKYMEARA